MSDSIFEHKKEKFLEFREQFCGNYNKTFSCDEAYKSEAGTKVNTAGRLIALRTMGKLLFAQLYDFTGKVQICVKKGEDEKNYFEKFIASVAIGDFIGVEGEMFFTKTGEPTIRVSSFQLLNKSLRPLPEKYHGLEDKEIRYRQRYLDIIMNSDSRNVFKKRFAILKSVRKFLDNSNFLEVETPVLQTQQSGALARPFYTHHNALAIDCVLRIAPETYLKRCIGAGFDKVYEVSRCFRNEGMDATHLQDFTMVEFYAAYWNSDDGIAFVENLFKNIIKDVFDDVSLDAVKIGDNVIDFTKKWEILDYVLTIKKYSGININLANNKDKLLQALNEKNIHIEDADKLEWAGMVDNLYKKVARPNLIQPCFLVKYPAEMSPLARRNKDNPDYVDQFQFLVNGAEIVKAYSELVDPLDQRARFDDQAKARELGDDEALPIDEDFLLAMEHGFPPICGVGFGIDRLVQVLCGCEHIRDTILFPLMRPQV